MLGPQSIPSTKPEDIVTAYRSGEYSRYKLKLPINYSAARSQWRTEEAEGASDPGRHFQRGGRNFESGAAKRPENRS